MENPGNGNLSNLSNDKWFYITEDSKPKSLGVLYEDINADDLIDKDVNPKISDLLNNLL